MKSRQKTLMVNIGLYVAIGIVVLFNLYFWKTYVTQSRGQILEMRASLDRLQKERDAKKIDLEKSNQKKQTYEAETESRRHELESYGDFLKKLSEKPDQIERLQKEIEELGLQINKVTYNPMSRGEGANYWTFNFMLELEGPYREFKRLLYKLPKMPQIFRIQSFQVLNFDNARHNWEVKLQLETYFSGQS